ncbi:unnamed protein product, partial [Enterobius vermicularis]|uniref:Uncharacterized protein n=1 Tax=Enterobius vermicularis TaxID=51028 RepID=A0A0N4VRP4_ENTVE
MGSGGKRVIVIRTMEGRIAGRRLLATTAATNGWVAGRMGRVHRGIWMDKRKSRRIEGLMSGWVVIGRRDGLAGKGKHADGYSSTADDCDGD